MNLPLESEDDNFHQIPTPKERLGSNVELASPASRLTFLNGTSICEASPAEPRGGER